MVNENSISIIVAALNEEKNLENTVITVSEAAKKSFDEYEVIIFNDGSSDRTGEAAEALAKLDKHFKVIHHESPKCLGAIYKEGFKLARMNYLILINGKDDMFSESFDKIFSLRGQADIVIPYTTNVGERPMFRRAVSGLFVWLLNRMFSLNLKYYNHSVLHKKKIIGSIDIVTNSYAFQAEILIKLIKSGYSYVEVGVIDKFKKDIKTKAFKLKNIITTGLFFARLVNEIYFNNKYKDRRDFSCGRAR